MKQGGGNGKQNNITGITHYIRKQSEEDHPENNLVFILLATNSMTNACIYKSGMLCHTDSEHGYNHHPQRGKTGEVGDHVP